MYCDLLMMTEVAAFITTMNFLPCSDTSPAAKAFWRQREAGQEVDLVAHDELGGQTLGDVGRDAADVLAHELELLAGDRIAVLGDVELDAVVELVAGVGELARIGQDDADLDRALGVRPGKSEEQRGNAG